jgi:hypothetical protein
LIDRSPLGALLLGYYSDDGKLTGNQPRRPVST